MKKDEKKCQDVLDTTDYVRVPTFNRNEEEITQSKTSMTVLEGSQEVNMSYVTEEIQIGGKNRSIKVYQSLKSPKMAEVLTNESIVSEAQFLVDKNYSDAIVDKVKNSLMGGMGKKGMMELVGIFMGLKPEKVFGGRCDKRIEKSVAVNCLFKSVKDDLPVILTGLMSGDDDESDEKGSGRNDKNRGERGRSSEGVEDLI